VASFWHAATPTAPSRRGSGEIARERGRAASPDAFDAARSKLRSDRMASAARLIGIAARSASRPGVDEAWRRAEAEPIAQARQGR